MSSKQKTDNKEADTHLIHQYYMSIINSIPDIVYWIDVNCNLVGCNNNFVALLGLNKLQDFNGTPYQKMKKLGHWSDERIDMFKLDDMNVIFSGEAQYNVTEKPVFDENEHALYFKSNRVPLYDEHKNLVGLVVVLTDIESGQKEEPAPVFQQEIPKADPFLKTDQCISVLMIEDNVIAQNVEKSLLTALNCQVDVAATGEKALELFDPGKYDLVLMDISLEGTSGYVVAKQLRNKEKDTSYQVPIIALTGYEADIVKYDCDLYCMQGAITKPLTSEQADQIIKHYVYNLDVPVNGLKSLN